MDKELLLNSIEEAKILGIFKNICTDYKEPVNKNSLRSIIAVSTNKHNTIKQIVLRKYESDITEEQADRLLELIQAFLKKSEYRKKISQENREALLMKQKYKCAFCGTDVNITDHADHIVPFKYVGDELKDNLQMLCSKCNEKKSDSIDYQIRFLLKLV